MPINAGLNKTKIFQDPSLHLQERKFLEGKYMEESEN